jgi:hypothetical protein
LFALIGLACPSAEAGDLKSATQSTRAVLVTPAAMPAAPANSEKQPAGTVGLFENGYGVREARVSGREKDRPPREHKTITFYHFNSQFGEVKVQPVFGRVNGAQLSLGF